MNSVVKISIVREESRIGSSFNHLISIINETEKNFGTIEWDFSETSFLHPFFLAPLAVYKNTSGKDIVCTNIATPLKEYLAHIHFNSILYFEDEKTDEAEQKLNLYRKKKYIPLCGFAMSGKNKDVIESLIRKVILQQCNANAAVTTALSYFMSELIDNINEHSQSKYGYIFSQYLEREHCIEICIADTGITVFKSFEKAGLYQEEIDGSEAEALKLANEGCSTKNLPDTENRGYGIPTTKEMLVEGLGGSFFMLSGGAFHRFCRFEQKKRNDYAEIQKFLRWNGTIILLKIPTDVPADFDYRKYL